MPRPPLSSRLMRRRRGASSGGLVDRMRVWTGLTPVSSAVTWERYDVAAAPASFLGAAPFAGTKHTRWARRTVDGCWYVLGGDYTASAFTGTDPLITETGGSGIHLLWKVQMGKPPTFTKLNTYVPAPGQKVPARVDEAPWMYDSKRDRFLLFPYPRWQGIMSDPGMIVGHLMYYFPATNTWQDLGTGSYTYGGAGGYDPNNNPQFDANGHQYPINYAKWGIYDDVTDKYYVPVTGSQMMILDAATLTMQWPLPFLGSSSGPNEAYWHTDTQNACPLFDRVRRRIVWVRPIHGSFATDLNAFKLLAYNIDSQTTSLIATVNLPFTTDFNGMWFDWEAFVHDEASDHYILYGGGMLTAAGGAGEPTGTNLVRAIPATGGEWVDWQPATATVPPERYGQSMHYDPGLGQFFEIGGVGGGANPATYTDPRPEAFFPNFAVSQSPQIDGNVWTPRRDGAGVVQTFEFGKLPIYNWLNVGTQTLKSVVPVAAGYVNLSGGDATGAIARAWSGAAWDSLGQVMYINGGGHGDTSPAETEIVSFSLANMAYALVQDRAPLSTLQSWDNTNSVFTPGLGYPPYNLPLSNGVPSSAHTGWRLQHIPGSVWGNSRGVIFLGGNARTVYDLDTRTYAVTSWEPIERSGLSWSDAVCWVKGKVLYWLRTPTAISPIDLGQIEATTWSPNSIGKYIAAASLSSTFAQGQHKLYCEMREREENLSLSVIQGFRRLRWGAAITAGATNWTPYLDTITLTSADGSHLDFNATTLQDISADFVDCGTHYDHATQAVYVCPNRAATRMYRITGLSGNTWTTEYLPLSTKPLTDAQQGTYGRFRAGRIGGALIGVRVAMHDIPAQVIRLA